MMWAFGVLEDDLETLYWSVSRYSLSKKIELAIGEKCAVALANYTAVNQVARNALGGSENSTPTRPPPTVPEPTNETEFEAWAAQVNQRLRY